MSPLRSRDLNRRVCETVRFASKKQKKKTFWTKTMGRNVAVAVIAALVMFSGSGGDLTGWSPASSSGLRREWRAMSVAGD